jgi:phenylalanyl-tRNA synthetase beta chain
LQPAISWQRGPLEIGVMGAVSPEILSEWGIKQPVWIADLNWDAILSALPKKALSTTSLNRFPTVRRDLAMVLDATTPYADIEAVVRKSIKKPLQTVELVDVYTSAEQLGPDKKSYAISLSFANPEKTLTDHEIDKMMETLINNLGQLKAEIRR